MINNLEEMDMFGYLNHLREKGEKTMKKIKKI